MGIIEFIFGIIGGIFGLIFGILGGIFGLITGIIGAVLGLGVAAVVLAGLALLAAPLIILLWIIF